MVMTDTLAETRFGAAAPARPDVRINPVELAQDFAGQLGPSYDADARQSLTGFVGSIAGEFATALGQYRQSTGRTKTGAAFEWKFAGVGENHQTALAFQKAFSAIESERRRVLRPALMTGGSRLSYANLREHPDQLSHVSDMTIYWGPSNYWATTWAKISGSEIVIGAGGREVLSVVKEPVGEGFRTKAVLPLSGHTGEHRLVTDADPHVFDLFAQALAFGKSAPSPLLVGQGGMT